MPSRLILAVLALLAIAALLLALAWKEPTRMERSEASITARAVENGSALYRDNCAGCHGVAGRGIPGLAPVLSTPEFFSQRLAEVGYPGSLRSYIESTIAAGRPASQRQYSTIMPSWGQAYGGLLRDDEIRDIASAILNWEGTAGSGDGAAVATPPSHGSATVVERGKAVFYGPAGCLGCHGQPGSGGVSGPDMAGIARRAGQQVPGLSAEQAIRQSILAPGAMLSTGCPTKTCPDIMPRDYGVRLRQADLDALVAYLLTLKEGGPSTSRGSTTLADADNGQTGKPVACFTATHVPTLRPPAGDPVRGQTLYEQECQPCHGDRGQGQWASSLAAVFASIDPYQYVRAAMDQGIPGATMPAWGQSNGGQLSDQQLDDIAAYVAGWAGHKVNRRPCRPGLFGAGNSCTCAALPDPAAR